MGSSVQQRRSAKTVSDKAQWRGRVRSECLQRVKDQRAGLLWRLRQEGGGGNGEYEELMRSLEESLFEDVRRDEAAFLAEHERWEAAAADSDLSMLEDLQAEDTSRSCPIPCPVCRNGHLTEHNGVVLCSSGDLRMDLRVEGLTLDDVRQRLANVLDAHVLQGCHGQPRFVLDTALMSDTPSLLMYCETCGSLHVVV
ncbi:hypothetical protein WJX75_003678 [Coccomyxa subellipsoidea]|uniref:RPA-interacting protein C-terminal domain-containing protein n=1 Tax=Coccomyxa subellipsoidea TaxID=248742 RepID=A0ABR2YDY4_9CHLO